MWTGAGSSGRSRSDLDGLLNLPSDVDGRLSERISLAAGKVQLMRGRRAVFISYINYPMLVLELDLNSAINHPPTVLYFQLR